MDPFQRIAGLEEIPDGQGRSFAIAERVIAVFRVGDQYFAIDDQCPHMGASLSAGSLEGCIVSCPLHAWRFDVRDGTWRDNPRVSIDHFRLDVRDDGIYIDAKPIGPADESS